MLQQTQVETVKPYWRRFLEKFPTVADLAAADLQEVLTLWAGLGYYRRARHLHAAARQIVADFAGKMPQSPQHLMTLPGVGRYTAGAVASIAFGAPVPVVDGNVMRVLARLAAYDRNIADPKNAPFFWNTAQSLHESLAGGLARRSTPSTSPETSRHQHGNLNEALMELGATICTPANPACLLCPLRQFCKAHAQGRQTQLPVKQKKSPTPIIRGAALVLLKKINGSQPEVLLLRRPHAGLWADMWEFPVMKEAPRAAPWVQAHLGLQVRDENPCGQIRHQLTHRTFLYDVLLCHVRPPRLARSPLKLPPCIDSPSAARYTHAQWLPWPLPALMPIPIARSVHKIAAASLEGK
jgi:A/G-specific adenine glycosylase